MEERTPQAPQPYAHTHTLFRPGGLRLHTVPPDSAGPRSGPEEGHTGETSGQQGSGLALISFSHDETVWFPVQRFLSVARLWVQPLERSWSDHFSHWAIHMRPGCGFFCTLLVCKTQVPIGAINRRIWNHLKAAKQWRNHPFSSVCQRGFFFFIFFYNELDANSFWYLCQKHRWASHNLPDEWLISFCSPLCSNCASWCFRMQVHSLPASLVLSLKVGRLYMCCFFLSLSSKAAYFCVFE